MGQKQDSLAARLRAGDRAAAAELVDSYYEQILLFFRRLGHDRQASEDLTQDTFFHAWHRIGQLRNGKALSGWLYRIAGNVSRLHWRRHKAVRTGVIEMFDVPGSAGAVSEKAGDREQLERLRDAVAGLPLKLRQVVVLHYMQHMTIAEGAEAAGVRQGTFKSRLNRALRTLKEQLS